MSTLTHVMGRARLPRMLLAIGLVIAGAAAATGAMVGAQEDQSGEIFACINRVSGAIRIASDGGDCTRYETVVSWNQQGPEGPQGDQGEPGQACWDLNGNGVGEVETEDLNGDGEVNVADCQGPAGLSTAFTSFEVDSVSLVYGVGLSDTNNHRIVNSLDLPAGTYIIQTKVELTNFLSEDFVPQPQNVQCYLNDGESFLNESLASATAAASFIGGPFGSDVGVTVHSTHVTVSLNQPATVNQLCFAPSPTEEAGTPASLQVKDRHMTAIQLDSIQRQ